jgi:hypothetical protein
VIRATNLVVFLHKFVVVTISGVGDSIAAGESLFGNWQTKFEYILQAVDNASVKPCAIFSLCVDAIHSDLYHSCSYIV